MSRVIMSIRSLLFRGYPVFSLKLTQTESQKVSLRFPLSSFLSSFSYVISGGGRGGQGVWAPPGKSQVQ